MPVPTAQTGFWPPPPPLPAQQPTPFCPGPAAQVNAWSQWPAYAAPQPGPGPVAQTRLTHPDREYFPPVGCRREPPGHTAFIVMSLPVQRSES